MPEIRVTLEVQVVPPFDSLYTLKLLRSTVSWMYRLER